ncbi:MAG: Lar family restriction alleviation protein [bacterium]|nr:Lar family restriction alleviation protein [bacterium]
MKDTELKPCPFCGEKPIIEKWSSWSLMFMVKCENPVCPIPIDGYPSGHDLTAVKLEWNRRTDK